jgi:prepilin-type N-terminal cleavage/methylation domain-containing protein
MLARIRKAMDEKEQGFTLIELLVVIIIIGILAAIAIPVFLNQRAKATESGMKSDLRTVANELETFFTDEQEYPTAAQFSGTTAGEVTINTVVTELSDPDTQISYTLTNSDQSYFLEAENTRINKSWCYDSAAGGIQTCPAVPAP